MNPLAIMSWEGPPVPTIKQLQVQVHDINGKRIDLEALVTNTVPLPSSAPTGDVPQGSILFVEKKLGAAFLLVDENAIRHVARGNKLALLKPGNPERPAFWTPSRVLPFSDEKAARGNAASVKVNTGRRWEKKR